MDKIKIMEGTLDKPEGSGWQPNSQSHKKIPVFNIGDTVKIMTRIPEGDKVRLHPFEGTVIAKRGSGVRTTFTVRKVSFGEGIERVFPLYSPSIESIKVAHSGKVKRAKLYYLRAKVGKETKIESAPAPRGVLAETKPVSQSHKPEGSGLATE